ncbi:hypothetical protein LTR85_011360 [Meristemomyces frigidus]|nr:hypothetical protein LTR85_011360 [Meristemomyces frigidus]
MAARISEDLDAAHSLLMLSRHAVEFSIAQRQRLHIRDNRLRIETQLEGLQQHRERSRGQERDVHLAIASPAPGTSITTDRTTLVRGQLPPTPAPSAPHTPQLSQPSSQDTVIPIAFSLNRTVTQTFCPHISSTKRKPECVGMTCDHFCCHKSHKIWQDHLTGQGPNHFQQLQEAQPRPRPPAPPPAKKKAGRPRKYPVQPQTGPPAQSQQHVSATAAPFPSVTHQHGMAPQYILASQYGPHIGGLHMTPPLPALYDMPHGLLLGRSEFTIAPTQLTTPSSYQARQGPMGSGFQPFPSTMQHPQLQSPAPQDRQYGILRQTQGGGLFEHTMRTMQAEQSVFDFRRGLPLAQRKQAQCVDLTDGGGRSTQMAGADGSTADTKADTKAESEVTEQHDVWKGRSEEGGSPMDED